MLRNVFLKTLRDQRRSLLWWVAGVAAMAIFTMAFYPTVADTPAFDELFENMPDALATAIMGDVTDYTSPEGFLSAELFGITIPFLFLIFAVGRGTGAIAGEEDRGTLELLLSYPLQRWRLVADKFMALVVATVVITVATWLSLLAGAVMVDMEIGALQLAEATLSAGLLGLVFGAFSLAFGSATGNRNMTIGVISGIAVAAYLVNAFASLVDSLEPARWFSPFYYYSDANPISNGLDWVHVGIMTGLVAVFVGLAMIAFERRDLSV